MQQTSSAVSSVKFGVVFSDPSNSQVTSDPKNVQLRRFGYKKANGTKFDVFYRRNQAAGESKDLPEAAVIQIDQADEAAIKALLDPINAKTIKDPKIRLQLRSMLTHALLSYDPGNETTSSCKIITQILVLCYAAGYDILAEPSLCAGKIDKSKIDYKSFLELAYRCHFNYAIETFYQLGHKDLNENILRDIFWQEGVITSDLMRLAIYYQPSLSAALQEEIAINIHNYYKKYFKSDKDSVKVEMLDRYQVLLSLLLYGSNYKYGVLNGGKTRIEQLYLSCYGYSHSGSHSDTPPACYHFGQYLFIQEDQVHRNSWQPFFRELAYGNADTIVSVQKYRDFRTEELSIRNVIQRLVKNPTGVSKTEDEEQKIDPGLELSKSKVVATLAAAQQLHKLSAFDSSMHAIDCKTQNQKILSSPAIIEHATQNKASAGWPITIMQALNMPRGGSKSQKQDMALKGAPAKAGASTGDEEREVDEATASAVEQQPAKPQTESLAILLKGMPIHAPKKKPLIPSCKLPFSLKSDTNISEDPRLKYV